MRNGRLYETDNLITMMRTRSGIATIDVDGGNCVVKGAMNANEKECYDVTAYATDGKSVWIAYNPVLRYVEEDGITLPTQTGSKFIGTNRANEALTMFKPEVGIQFGIIDENVDGSTSPTKGKFLEPINGKTTFAIKASQTADVPSFEVVDVISKTIPNGDIGGRKYNLYIVETKYNL